MVLFLTGPHYDGLVKDFYPDVKFPSLDDHPTREVCRVRARLPEAAFRTYHPGYLNRILRKKPYCLCAILGRIGCGDNGC